MSAASGRLIRILWIALVSALGLTAAWPDVTGADNGSAQEAPAQDRKIRGVPFLPALAGPVAAAIHELAAQAGSHAELSASTGEVRSAAAASRQAPHIRSDAMPTPLSLTTPQSELRQNIPSVPTHAPHQESPKSPDAGQEPEPADAPDFPPAPEIPHNPEPDANQPVPYVVIAYYLNVRAEPDKTSPIRGLLERGDTVDVVRRTDNGWLELENGLYIHGAYAEPAEPEQEPAKNAGREVSIASAMPHARPEPAVAKPSGRERIPGPAPLSKKVKSASGLTEEDIGKLLEGTALEGHGLEEAILGIEEEFGINALFTIAVMKLESGNGKSKLAREKNNLFGLNATGGKNSKAYRFETKSDSVYKFGSLIAKSYIAKGYSTIEKVGKKYCPANPEWASLVESIMKRDHRKLSKVKAVV